MELEVAKQRLGSLIGKSRVDLYKPIQIAEVLYKSRFDPSVDASKLETYRTKSKHWRDEVTLKLTGKKSTSSSRFQDNVWEANAMPPEILAVLDAENKKMSGAIERYIYMMYAERLDVVSEIILAIEAATPETFDLHKLLELFEARPGLRRSIDKAYEIITYSLFETLVVGLEATVTLNVPEKNKDLLDEFADLAKVLLGLEKDNLSWVQAAHIYRVGVTNAADRGLDMWANFGPAIQVKHLTLQEQLAKEIVDQVESDHIVVVCKQAEKSVIETVLKQIGWGKRVRGVITEFELVKWYEQGLRGAFSAKLAEPLLSLLSKGFKAEFPQNSEVVSFLETRGYTVKPKDTLWLTETEKNLQVRLL
jgi:HaeII restriction endonuclease